MASSQNVFGLQWIYSFGSTLKHLSRNTWGSQTLSLLVCVILVVPAVIEPSPCLHLCRNAPSLFSLTREICCDNYLSLSLQQKQKHSSVFLLSVSRFVNFSPHQKHLKHISLLTMKECCMFSPLEQLVADGMTSDCNLMCGVFILWSPPGTESCQFVWFAAAKVTFVQHDSTRGDMAV